MRDPSLNVDYSNKLRESIERVAKDRCPALESEAHTDTGLTPESPAGPAGTSRGKDYSASKEELALRRRAQLNAVDPAFPLQVYSQGGEPMLGIAWGLTKREQFAAMAMQGLAARNGVRHAAAAQLADHAIDIADALLARLEGAEAP